MFHSFSFLISFVLSIVLRFYGVVCPALNRHQVPFNTLLSSLASFRLIICIVNDHRLFKRKVQRVTYWPIESFPVNLFTRSSSNSIRGCWAHRNSNELILNGTWLLTCLQISQSNLSASIQTCNWIRNSNDITLISEAREHEWIYL